MIPQHAYVWGRGQRRTASYILRNEHLVEEYDAMRLELNITGFKLGKVWSQHKPSTLTIKDISEAVRHCCQLRWSV